MKTKKFKELSIGDTFYVVSDYARIDQYEKLSDLYAEQIMTASTTCFDYDDLIYVD
jgi:hypothetical protein